jgi:hypothetical protein
MSITLFQAPAARVSATAAKRHRFALLRGNRRSVTHAAKVSSLIVRHIAAIEAREALVA